MSMLANSNAIESVGYNINRSLRFRSSASAYLSRTPASAGNRRTFTWSSWVKRGAIGSSSYQFFFSASSELIWGFEGDAFRIQQMDGTGNNLWMIQTSQVFRDVSSWYHIVIAFDTTHATAANRVRVYVNGVEVTAFSSASYPTQNYDTSVNTAAAHNIGRSVRTSAYYFDGYLAEVNFIDGQALTPSSFGQTDAITGVWTPKKYTGTYGTNGFYLPFTDTTSATTLAYDKSGNGNNWTPNNISTTAGATYDSMTDVPTLTSASAANYAVWNPLKTSNVGSPSTTTQNGNLTTTSPTAYGTFATMAVASGKWYWEYTITTGTSWTLVGVIDSNTKLEIDKGTSGSNNVGYYANGQKAVNGSFTSYGSSFTTNDIIGVALDCDANTVQFYKNNVAQGSISLPTAAGTSITAFACDENNAGSVINVNFGQRPLSYTPPTGFKALNTFNLPDPTIKKGNQYMDATLWTGDSVSGRSITNAGGFQPDLVWVKDRSSGTYWNVLFDSVRGSGNQLSSNQTDAELASASSIAGKVSAFNANGFSLTTGSSSINSVNGTGDAYVGWQWKAGGTAVTNTAGSITSQVSANPTAGFSVVTWSTPASGAYTVGHGLGVAPKFFVIKTRNAVGDWVAYHASLGAGYNLILNTTAGQNAGGAGFWNSTAPSSSVLSIGSNVVGSYTIVAYCFSEIAGYSKFGSYTGNGSADGPFVNCGLKPRYIMVKRTDVAVSWIVIDTARNPYNVCNYSLLPNSSSAEITSSTETDILSNGFKPRTTDLSLNASGGTYIYMAFAENPFKYANAR